jgi:hypothetical protein
VPAARHQISGQRRPTPQAFTLSRSGHGNFQLSDRAAKPGAKRALSQISCESTYRGYKEKGSINTPLELEILNQIDRFNLAIDVIDHVPRLHPAGARVKEWLKGQIIASITCAHAEGVDKEEIREWKCPE